MTNTISNKLDAILTNARSKSTEIARTKVSVQTIEKTALRSGKKISEISDKTTIKLAEIESTRVQTKKEYGRFKRSYLAAMNVKEGIAARHIKIAALHTESSVFRNDISKDATAAKNLVLEVRDSHKTALANKKELEDIKDRADVIKGEIEDTYSIVLDTTMAGTLVNRRDDLKKRVTTWEWAYLISVGCVVAAVLLALTVSKPGTFRQVITERLVFVTPLVFIAFVISRQFGHERKLLEEYAFKAVAAQSLRGYTLLLTEQFKNDPEAQKDILEFVINAMKSIYDRQPLEGKLNSYHFAIGNKFAKIEAKLDERLDNILQEIQKEHPTVQQILQK